MTAPDAERLDRIWRLGEELVPVYCHGNIDGDGPRAVMWALLCHAARVSARAWSGPPRSGYPGAAIGAAMTADDISVWHKLAAYLRGELDAIDQGGSQPPGPTAIEVSACELVLDLYHARALRGLGAWRRLRAAVYMQACGAPPRKVAIFTGVNRHRLRHARDRVLDEMLAGYSEASEKMLAQKPRFGP